MKFSDTSPRTSGPTDQQIVYGEAGASALAQWSEAARLAITEKMSLSEEIHGRLLEPEPSPPQLPPPPSERPPPPQTPPRLIARSSLVWWAVAGPALGFCYVYAGGHGTPRPAETLIRAIIYSLLFTAVTVGTGIVTRNVINTRRQTAFAESHRYYQQQTVSLQSKYHAYVQGLRETYEHDVQNRAVLEQAASQTSKDLARMVLLRSDCMEGKKDPLDPEASALFGERVQRWAIGAKGEVNTAKLLEEQYSGPAVVLHDVGVPGQDANVDHLVCTSHGTYVIDSKLWSGRFAVRNGMLTATTGGHKPHDDPGATLWWEIDQLAAAAPTLASPAAAIILIHAGRVCDDKGKESDRIEYTTTSARTVTVVSPRGLVQLLSEQRGGQPRSADDLVDIKLRASPLIEALGPAT